VSGSRRIDESQLLPTMGLYRQKTDEGGFQSSRPASDHANRTSAYQKTKPPCRVVSSTAC
jgi:hypothetical protein